MIRNKPSLVNVIVGAVLVPGALALGGLARAQDFPTKPMRLIVHNSAGTSTDIVTRVLAAGMVKSLGQNIIVENRPGASGMVAYEYVAKRVPADGYTLVTGGSQIASVKAFVKDLRFDPLKDLVHISFFAEGVLVMAANASLPVNTFKELVEYAKANPTKLNWGTSGFTQVSSLNTLLIAQRHGLEVTQVPFQGNAMARPALISNQIQLLWHTLGEYAADSADRKIKPIIVSSSARLPTMPDVQTATEVGHPEVVGFYFGISATGGSPKPAIDRIHASIASALQLPEVKGMLTKYQMYVLNYTPEATARKVAELTNAYVEIAEKAGIKPQ